MRSASFFAVSGLLVVCLAAFAGCGRNKSGGPSGISGMRPHGHHHGHGAHGGHIVEFDSHEYHAEITQDETSQQVGVYLLDAGASAAAAVPIENASVTISVYIDDKPTEYALQAVVQPDDAAGKSSYFELKSEPLVAILSGAQPTTSPPELKLTVDDKSYLGLIVDEHAHGHTVPHVHSRNEADILVWHHKVSEAGYDIELGHHAVSLLAGSNVEPAVAVTREGEPIADAKVFNALLEADGETVLADEVVTVYEPPTEEAQAHYAQGALKIPPGTREAKIRFRVVLPAGGGEHSFDLPVTVQ